MARFLLWVLFGVILGGLIHLVVILTLPDMASRDLATRLGELDAHENVVVIDAIAAGEPNPLGLDPELVYGVCQLSLQNGPGVVNGQLPIGFWSVAIFNRQGHVIYSTTNRSGSSGYLDMGIFNPSQTRLLAEQRFEIEEGMLIVETPTDEIFVVLRVAPAHGAMRARYVRVLDELRCLTIR